jgi:hypothetical protein
MPTDKYTKLILTVIACGLLALVAQNTMGPSDTPVARSEIAPNTAPSNTAPSNKEARVFDQLQLCNSQRCIEMCYPGQHFPGTCRDARGDRSTTRQR